MWIRGRELREVGGRGGEEDEERSEGNTQWGQSQTAGQTDRSKKRRGDGREESPRSAQEFQAGARGTQLGAGGPQRAAGRRRGHRVATRDSPWLGSGPRPTLGRAGGAGRAAASLPPLASRRVWLGDSSGRGGGSASSGSQAAGPHQGGSRRPPLPAPPFSARLRLRVGPPAGTPSPAPCLWPLPLRPHPICPALPQPSSSFSPPSSR